MLKNRFFLVLLIGFLCLTGVNHSYGSSIPQMINYSGSLTDTGGTPVANGNYSIEFKIYNALGAVLWSEKWDTTTSQIPVVGGIFNVMLGFHSAIPAAFFADNPTTYLGIKVGTDSEMLPRQQITSVGYAFTAGNGVPKGGVIMWSGAIGDIPAGWALCDGTNGTPNLRDRFIVGAGSGYAVAATGGEATHTLTESEMPSHSHIQNPHFHSIQRTFWMDETPFTYEVGTANMDAKPAGDVVTNNAIATNQNTGGLNGITQAHENRPPYYALAFIMKL